VDRRACSSGPLGASIDAGERVTFVLKNFGINEHEFMAGRTAVSGKGYATDWLAAASAEGAGGHEMAHTGVGIRVAPNDTARVTVVVPEGVGDFEFGCFIAGHYEGGMKGKLVVFSNGDPAASATGAPAKTKNAEPGTSATPHPMGSMGDDGEGH
jgi:uncharacterized cupredoxin-like copper-binding protein